MNTIGPAEVTAIFSGFNMYTRSDPLPIKEDRVHFKNGTYFVNQKYIKSEGMDAKPIDGQL